MMQSEGGQTFQGRIDPYFVLDGWVTGNCIYDATWKKHQKLRARGASIRNEICSL